MHLLSTFSVSGTVIYTEVTSVNKNDTVLILRGSSLGGRQMNETEIQWGEPSDRGSEEGEGKEEEA